MIEQILKKNEIKCTKQRKLVYTIVLQANTEATLRYIEDKCHGEVDNATIYRIANLFIKKQLFKHNINDDGDRYYTINSLRHEHFVNCIKCHKKEKIDLCPVEKIEEEICKEKGFEITNHNLEISGICSECHEKK